MSGDCSTCRLLTQRFHESASKKYKPRTWGQWLCCLVPDEVELEEGLVDEHGERESNLITQVNAVSGKSGTSRRNVNSNTENISNIPKLNDSSKNQRLNP